MFTTFAINLVDNASQVLNKVDLSKPTWDIFLILFFITFAFFYGLFLGRDKIIHIIVSIFFSYTLVNNMNFIFKIFTNLTTTGASILKLTLFVLFIFLFFFVITKKSIFSSVSNYASSWWHVVMYSVIHTGLLISLSLSFMDEVNLSVFGGFVKNIFIIPQATFVWVLLSIFSIVFLKKKIY